MCTIIVTIRTVLWYVMSLAGTLMILVSLFNNKWLEGTYGLSNLSSKDSIVDTFNTVVSGNIGGDIPKPQVGLFMECKVPSGKKFFKGECIPDLENVMNLFNVKETEYPHAWRGAVLFFVFGLALMIITDIFALLTVCCRSCCCCSVFTVCGSIQSFASILFILGLVAYPAGWGSPKIKDTYCNGQSDTFILGEYCQIGEAFWLAVAGTACCFIASSLAIWAYQSTKSAKCEERENQGEHCICLP